MTAFAIAADRMFDGKDILENHAVVLESTRIADFVATDAVPAGVEVRKVAGLLAPGFIDVQVNGGGGVLFNDSPTVEGIRAIGAAHRRFGTTGFLPTLISDTREKMAAAVNAVRDGLAADLPGLLGVHLEGPFLNPERKGAHNANHIRQIEDEDIRIMTSLGSGRTLVTLAPEMVPMESIERLTKAGVLVSAGHTAASYETLREARKHGLTGYTHLFNAMPPLMSREPGPVGAALDEDDTWVSLIVDMHHVSEATLRVALSAKSADKFMLITDAMSPTGTDAATFELSGQQVYRRNGRLEFENGTLAGADLDMATALRNLILRVGAYLPIALRKVSGVPAAFLGLDEVLGRLAPGYRSNLVLLDDKYRVISTWIDGVEERVQ